ncbi:MAG TPA: hypothetical protein VE988_30470 [Gemmataceae bacterium]|nr:hypothetical protein [Gemmataceae bacterium]
MRTRHVFIAFVTLVAVVVVLVSALPALTQTPAQPGQGRGQGWQGQGGAGGMKGMGGMGMNPNLIFTMMAGGADTININDSGALKDMLMQFASSQGITGNTINRDQFSQAFTQMTQKIMAGDADTMKMVDNAKQQMAAEQAKIQQDPNGETAKKWADWREKIENNPEAKAALQKMREAFAKANNPEPEVEINPGLDLEELNKRPVVYRVGKLPNNLPAWFVQLDTDKDGQVGLYEWRHSNKSVEEFQLMDRNGDGLLTAEEVLFYVANLANTVNRTGKGTVKDFGVADYRPGPSSQMPNPGFNKGGQGMKKAGVGMNNAGQLPNYGGQGQNNPGQYWNNGGQGMGNGGQGINKAPGRGGWGKGG